MNIDVESVIFEHVKATGIHASAPKSETKDNKPIYPNAVIVEFNNEIVGHSFDYVNRIIFVGYQIDIYTKDGETSAKQQGKDWFDKVDIAMDAIGFKRESKSEETLDSKTYLVSLKYIGYIDLKTNIIYQNYNL